MSLEWLHAAFFVLGNWFSEGYNYNYTFYSLAELILQSCHTSCAKPSDYNYISEFQEKLILQTLRLETHFLILKGYKFVIMSVLSVHWPIGNAKKHQPRPPTQHRISSLDPWKRTVYPVVSWGFGVATERAQILPAPALDKRRSFSSSCFFLGMSFAWASTSPSNKRWLPNKPLNGRFLSVNSPALILSKNSGVFLAKIG